MSKKLTDRGTDRGIKRKASILSLILLMVGGGVLAAPSTLTSTTMAQQITAPETTTRPLAEEELREQNRLLNVTSAITRNLQQGEMKINGIVYIPRWSEPVWVQPNSVSVLFVYCLPGEYAESGQQILGRRDLNVLESYSLALSPVLTGWLMVVENEHQTERNPAAVGVICASDANDPESRILSPQEQIVINNVIKQFTTVRNIQITNITQVINIINNVTTNGTGGVVTLPPTNNTGGNNTGGGGVTPEPLRVEAELDPLDSNIAPAGYLFEERTFGGTEPHTSHWDFGDGQEADVPGHSNRAHVYHTYENPGIYTVTLTVTDATGQTASDSLSPLTVVPPPTNDTGGGVTPEPLRAQVNLDSTDIPFTHRFEASADGGTPPYTYHWDFGDEQEANVQNTRHTYENPGSYTATLTVTDSTGQTASDSSEVIVSPEPTTTGEPTTANETGGQ
jgi:chitodextrinase